MKILEIFQRLEGSDCFRQWRNGKQMVLLAHAFNTIENGDIGEWQVGYYNPSSQLVSVFEVSKSVRLVAEDEAFAAGAAGVKLLDINRIKIDYEVALGVALGLQAEKYPQVSDSKTILILQNLELGQVWNITFVSPGLEVLNIKVGTEMGEIIEESLKPLFSFK
ncbi:hypothetical protein KY320_02280 [Candidatus Woesearchaeota archaeon]|nr:hypothetical protein [Candidatus Woesearchaeota archaeon]